MRSQPAKRSNINLSIINLNQSMEFEVNTVPTYQETVEKAAGALAAESQYRQFVLQKSRKSGDLRLTLTQSVIKRSFDILVTLTACVLFSPIIIVIALLIWAYDFHTPIFSQTRVGRGGKEFTIYKFRSMRIDSESDGVPRLCEDHDSRLTGIGAFLRAHHLDEFPQLWNVLRGDMSIVGPRPERPYFTVRIIEKYPDYLMLMHIRPGLFSEATLYNGYTETIDQMVRRAEMDIDYLRGYSFARDIKIIYDTTMSILLGKKF